jgi:hypothetical protein
MATDYSTIESLLERLSSVPDVHARKMFGEYALYCGQKVVALVCNDQLFVKITPPGLALIGDDFEEGEAYPGAKPSMLIDFEYMDFRTLCELIRVTAAALPVPKPKKLPK